MGVVWQARDEELDLEVALKFLPSIIVNDRASLSDLKRETRRSLELTHPNIVRTYDFLQDSSFAGISMEYVDSNTLRNRRIEQPSGVFQAGELGEWTVQLCDALDYAHHTASIVHRDLKPANLLINGRKHLKVADFGISRSLVESVTQVTGGNSVSGTLVYMSPQQLDGETTHPLDDVYSVGATLYELCTSRPPFYTGDIARQVHLKVPPSMAARRTELGIPQGNLPQHWEATVAACLAKDPSQRPQSASEVAVRLGLREAASHATTIAIPSGGVLPVGAGGGQGFSTNAPTAPLGAPTTHLGLGAVPMFPAKRNPRMAWAAAATVFILAVIGGIWLIGSHNGKKPTDQGDSSRNVAADAAAAKSSATADTRRAQEAAAAQAAHLANARGSIFVETDPPGARVKVDDRPAEKTPVPLKDLTLGQHSVKIVSDGYEDYTTQAEVKENQTTALDKIKLVRSIGWLNVTTTPPGADVTIKGPDGTSSKASSPSPWSSDKLPVGDYEISASRAGWLPVVKKVTLTRDQSMPVAFDLSGGGVQITSVPSNATVLVNGKQVGKTPYSLQDVQPGDVQYGIASAGYANTAVQGKIEAGQVLTLDTKLTKAVVAAKPHSSTHTVASTRSTSHSQHASGDGDPHRGEDGIDKARRVGDMLHSFGGLPFPHP